MNRIGLTHPSTLTGKHNAETNALYHAFSDYADRELSASNVTYKLPSTGALVGPLGILLHTPHIGRAYLDFLSALQELSGLTPRSKEIIALVVAAYERAAYQFYAHGRLAAEAGLTQNELNSLHAGLFSQSFTDQDKAVYNIARGLCVSSGPLPQKTWNEAVTVLGRPGAVAAVQYTAFNRYVSTILRGFDAQVPAPGERVENQSQAGPAGH